MLELEPVEMRVINESRAVFVSPEFGQLREAFQSVKCLTVQIGEWVVQFETDVPERYFGVSLFGVRGFVLSKLAFQSETELQKTVLWELYRLCTGQGASGAEGAVVASQTTDADSFVNRVWTNLQLLVRE